MSSKYALIPVTTSHFDFLRHVHHTTLKGHIEKIWGWDEKYQDEIFRKEFKPFLTHIIQVNNQKIGYLELSRKENSIHIINLLILPEFQGSGTGTQIMKDIIEKAQMVGKFVELGVFKVNEGAKNLYEKLGFQIHSETETHFIMRK